MPGLIAGPSTGYTDRAKGKGTVSKSWLAQIGNSAAQAAGGGCIFAAIAAAAAGSWAFSANPAANSTLTIGSSTWTFVTSGATGNQTNIGGSLAATLASLLANLQASADGQVSQLSWGVNGSTLNAVQKTPGTGGNTFAIAASSAPASHAVASGSTLSGGSIPSTFSQFGNGADTTEDTLLTMSLPANLFDVAGRNLEFQAWGNIAATSATKTARMYFGSSIVQPVVATTTQTGLWQITANIWKAAANIQSGYAQLDFVGGTLARTINGLMGCEPDSAAIVAKITGQSTVGTANLVELFGVAVYAYN
jgi:hypothetical protein